MMTIFGVALGFKEVVALFTIIGAVFGLYYNQRGVNKELKDNGKKVLEEIQDIKNRNTGADSEHRLLSDRVKGMESVLGGTTAKQKILEERISAGEVRQRETDIFNGRMEERFIHVASALEDIKGMLKERK